MTGRSLLDDGVLARGSGGGDAVGLSYDSARRRFETLLGEFLRALSNSRTIPPMLADGQGVDLYKLFLVVKGKGGYDAVCDGRLWDLVGEESGFDVRVGPFVKVVYHKYLSPLDTWMKKVADSKVAPECGLVGDRDRDRFGRCLMELKAEVKGLLPDAAAANKVAGEEELKGGVDDDFKNGKELRELMNESVLGNLFEGNDPMEVLEGIDGEKMSTDPKMDASDAVNGSMPGLLSEGEKCAAVVALASSDGDSERPGIKRKRQSMLDLLRWVSCAAKNPHDPAVGLIPEMPKWKSCSNQEPWKQVLLFREAAFFQKVPESSSEQQTWQTQKMHPCLYDGSQGSAYNLRERPKCSQWPSSGKLTSAGRSSSKPSLIIKGDSDRTSAKKELLNSKSVIDGCSTECIPLGSDHQVEVPEWTGLTAESDSKWLGTQIWPLQKVNSRLLIEREPIGKGRRDSCGCSVPGSIDCVRFHIAEKRDKVKLELGIAFNQWNFDKIGEDVRLLWTDEEEKKFKDAVEYKAPKSEGYEGYFWDLIFKTFPQKSTADLVSYYFNVFLLQRRGHQNRHTPDGTNSDDDKSEEYLRNVFGKKSRGSILLTVKKRQPKRRRTK